MNRRFSWVLVLACLAVAVTPAFAAKPPKPHGATTPTSNAWVSASPNPASAGGQRVYLTGCGYAFAPVTVRVAHSAGGTEQFSIGMWSTGCLDNAYFVTREAGTYTITVLDSALAPVATTSLEVR